MLKRENLWRRVVDYPELEALKESYENGEIEVDGSLSLSQLDKVAGGMRRVKKTTSPKNTKPIGTFASSTGHTSGKPTSSHSKDNLDDDSEVEQPLLSKTLTSSDSENSLYDDSEVEQSPHLIPDDSEVEQSPHLIPDNLKEEAHIFGTELQKRVVKAFFSRAISSDIPKGPSYNDPVTTAFRDYYLLNGSCVGNGAELNIILNKMTALLEKSDVEFNEKALEVFDLLAKSTRDHNLLVSDGRESEMDVAYDAPDKDRGCCTIL